MSVWSDLTDEGKVHMHLAEISAFQHRRSARMPSPMPSNGGPPPAWTDPRRYDHAHGGMRAAFDASCHELEYRPRGE